MSRIVWDATGEREFETGVSKGVLYVQGTSGTYPKGVAWNGLTSVQESSGGAELTDLWADNIKYASIRAAETFGATINAYTFPDEFYACDGVAEVADGVYIGQQNRDPFGFCYRTEVGNDTPSDSDDNYKIHIVYNATASPSEKEYETINDSPDAITLSWEISTTPINVTGRKPTATMVIESKGADPQKLKALEDVLYGSEDSEPRLPLPDEIIQMMSKTSL